MNLVGGGLVPLLDSEKPTRLEDDPLYDAASGLRRERSGHDGRCNKTLADSGQTRGPRIFVGPSISPVDRLPSQWSPRLVTSLSLPVNSSGAHLDGGGSPPASRVARQPTATGNTSSSNSPR